MLVKQEEYAKLPHRNKLENNKKNIGFFSRNLRQDFRIKAGITPKYQEFERGKWHGTGFEV